MLRKGNLEFGAQLKIADTFIKRFIGLMGRNSLNEEEGLILKPCNSIHTMFMKFSIDCIYLNDEDKVIYVESLKPWRIGKIVNGCRSVIELPEGSIKKFNIQMGDKIIYEGGELTVKKYL